jgi:hypothetical protein
LALLAGAGAAGLWLWRTHGAEMPLLPAAGLLALTALGAIGLYRVRAARSRFRLYTALNTYADQQLARTERRPPTASGTDNRAYSRSNV